jgi:asparagine synthase (glutamine-hydrolysing)
MPSAWKVRGVEKKLVLRNSQRERLPADILDGPKIGFGVPFEHWLRTSLYDFARGHLLDPFFLKHFALDGQVIERMLVQHKERGVERGFMLWKLLQLALFLNVRNTFK